MAIELNQPFYPRELARDVLREYRKVSTAVLAVSPILFSSKNAAKLAVDRGIEGQAIYDDVNGEFAEQKIDEKQNKTTDTHLSKYNVETSKEDQVIVSINEGIREEYKDTIAQWLPSESDNPRSEHEGYYFEYFYLDKGISGELPGDAPGCQCGFMIVDRVPDGEIITQ